MCVYVGVNCTCTVACVLHCTHLLTAMWPADNAQSDRPSQHAAHLCITYVCMYVPALVSLDDWSPCTHYERQLACLLVVSAWPESPSPPPGGWQGLVQGDLPCLLSLPPSSVPCNADGLILLQCLPPLEGGGGDTHLHLPAPIAHVEGTH